MPAFVAFILDLAVRGKLVPCRYRKDEPASELLKRIAAEKALLKAGESETLSRLTVSEASIPIPANWRLSQISLKLAC